MSTRTTFIFSAAAALICSVAWAQQSSPAGLWRSIDDETGKPKALIRITEQNGEFNGKIEKLFRAQGEEQNPKCELCEGERKGQPIVGMTILTGMKPQGDEYAGGQIIDPANGKVYKSKMAVTNNGKKLDVRGYVGMPMLGRTQTWERVE